MILTIAKNYKNSKIKHDGTQLNLGDDPLLTATITFNGSKREKERGPLYWRKIVPGLYFQRTPRKNLYCYSFAQHPSTWYPSGSVNLSRIDNCALDFVFATVDANGVTYGAAEVSIICENFNVIRIQGGMAEARLIKVVRNFIEKVVIYLTMKVLIYLISRSFLHFKFKATARCE